MLVSTTTRTNPLGSDLSHGISHVGGHLPLLDGTACRDVCAPVKQSGETPLPLIVAHRASALAPEPFVDSGPHQARDRLTAPCTKLAQQG